MNTSNDAVDKLVRGAIPMPPERTPQEERVERKTKLAAALRVFGRFGFDEGVAGHITARDPFNEHHFWVNPVGRSFKLMQVSDLIKVDAAGKILEGEGVLNQAAFAIHSRGPTSLPPHIHIRSMGSRGPRSGACSIRSPKTPARSIKTIRSSTTTPASSST